MSTAIAVFLNPSRASKAFIRRRYDRNSVTAKKNTNEYDVFRRNSLRTLRSLICVDVMIACPCGGTCGVFEQLVVSLLA